MIRSALLALAGVLALSPAMAASATYTATLANPLTEKKQVVANSSFFRCEGTSCVLASSPTDAGSVSTCRKLARSVGEIKSYGLESAPFDAEKLARCNAK